MTKVLVAYAAISVGPGVKIATDANIKCSGLVEAVGYR